MRVGVTRETAAGERRVALVPDSVGRLAQTGIGVVVEPAAGVEASYPDEEYREAGAELGAAWDADVVQEAARSYGLKAFSSPLERLGDRERETRDAARVATRPGVRLLDRFRQVCDHGRQSSRLLPSSLLGERK